MELKEYLGPKILDDIKFAITENAKEFCKQTPSTKLALADGNNYNLAVYKEGVKHLINALDDVAAENELLENQNEVLKEEVDRFQTKYGEVSQDFLDKQKSVVVVRNSEKSHAKKAMAKYIQKYDNQQRND